MPPSRNRLVTAVLALILGLAAGAVAAFAVRGGFTAVSQEDPCYGHGELITTGSWTITEEMAEMAGDLVAVTVGEKRELHYCAGKPFETFLIDGPTGGVLDHRVNLQEAAAYYEEHPEENPALKTLEEFERNYQESLVPADIPTDLTAGCDPSWVTTTFEQARAVMCHPAEWVAAEDSTVGGSVRGDAVQVGVDGLETESHNTRCLSPTLVDVPSGTARACASRANPTPYARIGYGIALPNGRSIGINVFNEATAEAELTALRVAANVESLVTFVPADVPTDLTAGCDPSWVVMTFERLQAVMCHPPTSLPKGQLWEAREHNPVSADVGSGTVQVTVLGMGIASPVTPCPAPTLVEVPSGTAEVCAVDTSSMAGLRSVYGVTLPNGREVAVTVGAEGTAEDEETALRIAANVEALP